MPLPPEIRDEILRIGADRSSGATTLVLAGIDVLRWVAGDPARLPEAARMLCALQPSMAGFRTAAALALTASYPSADLDVLAERLRRGASAIARFAAPLIALRRSSNASLTVVTCSRSALVELTLRELARREALIVRCAESLPGAEGRRLAEALAGRGIAVELYGDAGIGTAVADSDAVVVGADAVTGSAFVNKAGTAALSALARALGRPVVILAGREKLLPESIFALLSLGEGLPGSTSENGISARNPLFERVPLAWADQLVTEAGVVGTAEALKMSLWTRDMEYQYMSLSKSNNMLDTC
jgi:hypothetical protein